MRYASSIVILAIAILLILIGWTGYRSDPIPNKSTLWSVNLFLGGEDLRLFESGRYESLQWGDLPPYTPHDGLWRAQGDSIYLIPNEPKRPLRVYHRIHKFGCTFLRRPGLTFAPDLFPSGITPADFSLEGSGCRKVVQQQDELGRRTRH